MQTAELSLRLCRTRACGSAADARNIEIVVPGLLAEQASEYIYLPFDVLLVLQENFSYMVTNLAGKCIKKIWAPATASFNNTPEG